MKYWIKTRWAVFLIITNYIYLVPLSLMGAEDSLPILQFYINNKVNDFDYFYSAVSTCEVEVINKNSQSEFQKSLKDPCMTPRDIYQLDELRISKCEWKNESPESPIKSLGDEVNKMKLKLQIKNIKISIRDSTLYCQGDLLLPVSQKLVEVESPCAPPMGPIKDQKLSVYKPMPVVAFMQATKTENSLTTSISKYLIKSEKEKSESEKSQFSIGIAIPLPMKISQYIQYLLSAKAERDCNNSHGQKRTK